MSEPDNVKSLVKKLLAEGETPDQIRAFADKAAAEAISPELQAEFEREGVSMEDYRENIHQIVGVLLGDVFDADIEESIVMNEPWRAVEGPILYWLTWMGSSLMTDPLQAMKIAEERKGTPFEISPQNIRAVLARLDEIPGDTVREYPKPLVFQRLTDLARMIEETELEMKRRGKPENN